ncbi:cytochrome c3 family protein [candidate division KSB1 bacterium]|nr:cytochrome c3 family protein [candidate division KSB1 bacterium]
MKLKPFTNSVHGENGCVSCHVDADVEDFPHDSPLQKVDCGQCHDKEAEDYHASLHGIALAKNDPDAPRCIDCHGYHDILPPSDPKAQTYIMNIPVMCGKCHKEGSQMVRRHNIPEKDIIQNYSMSIHGAGLFNQGLIVTAVCTSCHTSHRILPHTDPASSINRNNIAKTCMKCHAQIEKVHLKVIRGELWEKQPNIIPACIECHSPHKIRKVFYYDTMSDDYCMKCHSRKDLIRTKNGQVDSLYVDTEHIATSAHGNNIQCVKCHVNVSHRNNPVCKDSGPVDCSICHAQPTIDHQASIHGQLSAKGDKNAPDCRDCHGTHHIQLKSDVTSPIFKRNIPQLCGKCHRAGEEVALRFEGETGDVINLYTMSIHGKGLIESGLLVTAICTDCHTSHYELPPSDPNSSVNHTNIAKTCGQCHFGIYEEFSSSIHSPTVTKTDKKLPSCPDCHKAHQVIRIDEESFRQEILAECGTCHEHETETYFDTYHGKVSLLGSGKTAKCSDCHGSHGILPTDNPKSMLSQENVVETCKKCHPNSNRQFTGYLTHATHHNRVKYPFLFYTFWAMTFLLIGTFSFFGLHTLIWIPRSFRQRYKMEKELEDKSKKYYKRFDFVWRLLHIIVIVSFFGLAITGMTLKFASTKWAELIARMIGGFEVAGAIHRFSAVLTFIYFAIHFVFLYKNWKKSGKSLFNFIFDKEGLFPNWRDVKEFFQTVFWFFGRKKQPQYGRWTYWEKFDYLAVFWGVSMIGISGLILWFPEFFTKFLPGYLINVATIIHSDEALLATGFIFTVHFFNTHFRPEKFPMDPVIFTGTVPFQVFKHERPREFEMETANNTLNDKLVGPPSKLHLVWSHIFGLLCLAIGFSLVGLIIYAMIFQYK